MKVLFFSATLLLLGCADKNITSLSKDAAIPLSEQDTTTVFFKRPERLSVTGDFDGDGRQDTLASFIADSTGHHVDNVIDNMKNEWDSVVDFYDRNHFWVGLAFNGSDTDIETGVSMSLFCLINMGNVNGSKGDEVALVPALKDYSNLNSCHIWSLCSGKWAKVKQFRVHESAFDYDRYAPRIPFTEIAGYLEKHNGQWLYKDFYEEFAGETEFQKLIIPACP